MPNSEKPLDQIKIPDGYSPSDKEEFMSPLQLAYFRKKLLDWKNELINGASDTILGLSEETLQKPDAADRAQLEADASILLRARDRERKLISKIENYSKNEWSRIVKKYSKDLLEYDKNNISKKKIIKQILFK